MKKPTPKASLIEFCNEIIEDHRYKRNRTKSPSAIRNSDRIIQLFSSIKYHLEQ